MIPIVLASVLIACAFGCGTPPIEPLTTRVVNGVDAKPHSWPWQISLRYMSRDGFVVADGHLVVGSLMCHQLVMTGCACINHLLQADWWGIALRHTMVCAGGDGIVAGCNGDSGGPLNCKNPEGVWEVHGIASFVSGLGCNYVKKPTVFTRVSNFTDWIDQAMMSN
nr:chymotrypsin-C-like [Salvelinus alpinus]